MNDCKGRSECAQESHINLHLSRSLRFSLSSSNYQSPTVSIIIISSSFWLVHSSNSNHPPAPNSPIHTNLGSKKQFHNSIACKYSRWRTKHILAPSKVLVKGDASLLFDLLVCSQLRLLDCILNLNLHVFHIP